MLFVTHGFIRQNRVSENKLGPMSDWKSISAAELRAVIAQDLSACSPEIHQWFEAHRIPLRPASIRRSGVLESVFVVAQQGSSILYYEDVEEGFNISSLTVDGEIAKPGYEQWDLRTALWNWTQQCVAADRREDAPPAER
jgi:hypothetical protein